jgi:topoisomerase IA-like protein
MPQWIVRENAAAMLIQEQGMWAESGYFGNEGYDAMLYTVAAIEVDQAPAKKTPAKKTPAKKTPAKKTPAKAKAKPKRRA